MVSLWPSYIKYFSSGSFLDTVWPRVCGFFSPLFFSFPSSQADDSLRKSFDLFGEIDMNYHNRFFRFLGLSDNIIKTTEMTCSLPEDRVYELLKVWMEKEGMKADFNSLIEALCYLNQKLSAESIIARAIESGYFRYEDWKQAQDLLWCLWKTVKIGLECYLLFLSVYFCLYYLWMSAFREIVHFYFLAFK